MHTASAPRVVFLDNVRTFAVLAVVALHAACTYAHIIPWWSVLVPAPGPFYDLVIVISDIFVMPTLFFVAGYFALTSLLRRGRARLVGARARRLLAPFAVVGLAVVPVAGYVRLVRNSPGPHGYADFWMAQMRGVDFEFVDLSRVDPTTLDPTMYSPWHLWFLPMLMLFVLCLCLVPAPARAARPDSGRRVLAALALAAVAVAASTALVLRNFPGVGWAMLSNFLLFQPSRMPLYAASFALGAWAHARRWFEGRPMPGPIWAWSIATLALCAAHLAVNASLEMAPPPVPVLEGLTSALARTGASLAALGLILSVASRRFNRTTPLGRSLAASSYTVYLLHLPVLIVLQHLATRFMTSPHAMFALTLPAGFLTCHAAHWATTLLRPPRRFPVDNL